MSELGSAAGEVTSISDAVSAGVNGAVETWDEAADFFWFCFVVGFLTVSFYGFYTFIKAFFI